MTSFVLFQKIQLKDKLDLIRNIKFLTKLHPQAASKPSLVTEEKRTKSSFCQSPVFLNS